MPPNKVPATTIQPHGDISTHPIAIYGSGSIILRLGNGGAGATGLLEAFATAYLAQRPGPAGSISWVCNHSRNTQLALLYGYIDIALTYERDQEAGAAAEEWSVTRGCVFHDHFCLAGPLADLARVSQTRTLHEAFARIATTRAMFHSRADGSATMAKERSIWEGCGVQRRR